MERAGQVEVDRVAGRQGRAEQEEQVDSRFSFLSTAHADLLNEILARRSSTLLERIRQANSVSRSDAEEIMSVISDEVTENLDDDWEPTITARLSVPCSRTSTQLASTSGPEGPGDSGLGGDRGGTGVRLHHGFVHLQRPARAGHDRYDDRPVRSRLKWSVKPRQ
jgi:hypothetical protein